MVQPDGSRFEIGHTAETAGEDVRIDYSLQRARGSDGVDGGAELPLEAPRR